MGLWWFMGQPLPTINELPESSQHGNMASDNQSFESQNIQNPDDTQSIISASKEVNQTKVETPYQWHELASGDLTAWIERCGSKDLVVLKVCGGIVKEMLSRESNQYSLDAENLAAQWLESYPESIDVALLLADRYRRRGKDWAFLNLIENTLFVIEPGVQKDILEGLLDQFAQGLSARQSEVNQNDQRVQLFERLCQIKPERLDWRFTLANLQIQFGMLQPALNSLSYLLYEPQYAERAQALYDQIVERSSQPGDSNIALEQSNGHFLVRAKINYIHEVVLLIDTGASITSIRESKFQELGLNRSGQQITLHTAGGSVNSTLENLEALTVGDQSVANIKVATLGELHSGIDGLLGMNFLSKFDFIIDQDQSTLRLSLK